MTNWALQGKSFYKTLSLRLDNAILSRLPGEDFNISVLYHILI